MRFTCTICRSYASPNPRGVLRHIGSVHSYEPDFKVTCGIGGCPRTYVNFRSFQKHIRRMHTTENDIDLSIGPQPPDVSDGEDIELDNPNVCHQTLCSLKHGAALFLLKTKEKGRVSQATFN